ncbi:MAG: DUF3089 domain-containing protein [Ruminococcaceae bacterium]|nr:DUF3089 domain-containing protein [Oscillospiraceae bacterium]
MRSKRSGCYMIFVIMALCLILTVPAAASSYTVVKGDCLWRITQRYVGTGVRWPELYELNRGQIRDPDLIYPDQVFEIPGGWETAAESPAQAEPDADAPPEEPEPAEEPEPEAVETSETQSEPAEPAEAEPEAAAEPAETAPEATEPAEPEADAAEDNTQEAQAAPTVSTLPDRPLVGTPVNYADKNNWALLPDEITKSADTLYLYTMAYVDTDDGAPQIAYIDNKSMREAALNDIDLNCGVFSESTNVYAPFYRQSNLAAIADLTGDELLEFQMQEQRTDVYAALDYYFSHYNDGRPFILAGHSQGSIMLKLVLREYMALHPEYYERMICAYVLGYSVTTGDISASPHLRFAEGADDTGVIVSWNTEGQNNGDSFCVLPGALAINPINWQRDDTYAFAADSLGSRIVNPDTGEVDDLVPGLADAQVNLERGVVICYNGNLPLTQPENPAFKGLFGSKSYHNGDYGFYYYNLRENVKTRTDAWFKTHAEGTAAP